MNARICSRGSSGGFLSAAVITFQLVAGCSSEVAPPSDSVRPVKTMVVAAGDDTHVRSFPGKVEASRTGRAGISGARAAGQAAGQGRAEGRQGRSDRPTPAGRIPGPADSRCKASSIRLGRPWRRCGRRTARGATAARSAGAGGRGAAGQRPDGVRSRRAAGASRASSRAPNSS